MSATAARIEPKANENESSFVIRAHRALMKEIPDSTERNAVVWDAWDSARGPSRAEQLASKHFPAERYEMSPGHCYFAEHETTRNDGTPVKYSVNDLVGIINNLNHRVLERECFQAITEGHTSDNQKAGDEPTILGYSGPYRLGMIGHEKPVFAIFGNEYHNRAHQSTLANRPRRSVELLTLRSTGERFFDPIAALGARSPRLAMPAKYSQIDSSEVEIDRYSFTAPASFPGGSNTYIPGPDEYSADSDEEQQSMNGSIANEDIAKIVQAMMETPEMQFVRSQMQGGAAPGMGGGMPPGMDPGMGGGAAGGMGDEDPMGGGQDAFSPAGGGESGPPTGDFSPIQEDDDQSQYEMTQYDRDRYQALEETVERYQAENAALKQDMQTLRAHHGVLAKNLANVIKEKADVKRKSQLTQLVDRYSIFDLDEECQRCLYEAGSDMSDKEFEAHVAQMEKLGARARPMSVSIPDGVLADDRNTERYAAENELAVEIHTESANNGEFLSYDQCLAKAREQLKSR